MDHDKDKKTGMSDPLLDSNYDGIQEYDNDLPRWWVYLFVLTVVFSIAYSFYYHLGGPGISPEQQLALEMDAAKKDKERQEPARAPVSENVLIKLAAEPSRINSGKLVYAARCAACHGPAGQGIVGPNLTDDYWMHGGKISEIKGTIENGIVEKGMLAWKGVIKDEEIMDVVSYIWSIRGTSPENPKAPQGDLVVR